MLPLLLKLLPVGDKHANEPVVFLLLQSVRLAQESLVICSLGGKLLLQILLM